MTQKVQVPTTKTIATYIKDHSPDASKCIDADFITVNDICILAWIVDIPFPTAKNTGFYQALYTTYKKGKFGRTESTIPCQYCDDEGKRIVTTTGFISDSEKEEKSILSVSEMTDESRIKVTLICHGKPRSQSFIRLSKALTR